MSEREVINNYTLEIRHYEGDQTDEELFHPCSQCLLKDTQKIVDWCKLFDMETRSCQRICIGNYRIDQETLLDAMERKLKNDAEKWEKWVNSFHDYVDPEDGSLTVISSPEDFIKIAKELDDHE